MKKLIFIGLLALAPLGACSAGDFVQSPTVQGAALSATSTSIRQASSLKAAGDLYVLAVQVATGYLNSEVANKAIERQITPIEASLYQALIDGQKAEAAGNSPAAGAALSLFNSNYAALAAILPVLK